MPPLRVLLDECVDRRLASHIKGHHVTTVPGMGWSGVKNGDLLKMAEDAFDVFVTVDRNLAFQQKTSDLKITVLVLCGRTNRLVDLIPLMPKVIAALKSSSRGKLIHIS